MLTVALATCLHLPEPDVDQNLMLEKFNESGLATRLAAWDDPAIDWGSFDMVVVRSTWDYPERPGLFLNWIDYVNTKTELYNPASIMKSNVDKRYLLDLEALGVRIVPTKVASHQSFECYADWTFEETVIKPSVGAGSWLTKFFNANELEESQKHIKEIENHGSVALVQPYMQSVKAGGERSLIFIDGEFTHKIIKSPRFDGDQESVSESLPVTAEEANRGNEILNFIEEDLLYGRIDFIVQDGNYYLSELELIEPSLFLLQNPSALDRLIEGVKRRL